MISLLLTGSTGFIGSAVHRHLAGRPGVRLRLLRRDRVNVPLPGEIVHGDLAEATPLPELCAGMDVVVHAASYVGPDPDLCDRVNYAGTARLLHQARRAGVPTFVYVSTASIYGRGPHSNITEDAVTPHPQSPVSSSRLAAENLTRAAGGMAVRPHLVYGAGDRWVVPTLVRLLPALHAWIDNGTARMSMIRVDDLARLICELALHPPADSVGAVYHANHPEPAIVREVGGTLRRHLGISLPSTTMTYHEAVRSPPAGVGQRHLDMLSLDHWYASQRLWTLTGCTPGTPVVHDLSEAAVWYPALVRRLGGMSAVTEVE
jgi:nucleoside-diphosphate-sugar epimerase